jgi:hypothetical protein
MSRTLVDSEAFHAAKANGSTSALDGLVRGS